MHSLSRSSLPHLLYRFPDRFGFSCGLCICMRAEALAASNALLLSNKESEGNLRCRSRGRAPSIARPDFQQRYFRLCRNVSFVIKREVYIWIIKIRLEPLSLLFRKKKQSPLRVYTCELSYQERFHSFFDFYWLITASAKFNL